MVPIHERDLDRDLGLLEALPDTTMYSLGKRKKEKLSVEDMFWKRHACCDLIIMCVLCCCRKKTSHLPSHYACIMPVLSKFIILLTLKPYYEKENTRKNKTLKEKELN